MTSEIQLIHYAWPDSGAFWRWSPDAEAVVWNDGSTLAFYQEIELALRRLQPHGWPRFEEILLVAAACRRNWLEHGRGQFAAYLDGLASLGWQVNPTAELRAPLIEQLDKVHQIADRAKFGRGVSAWILDLAFLRRGDQVGAADAASILELFRSGTGAARFRDHAMVAQLPIIEGEVTEGLLTTMRNVIAACTDIDPNIDVNLLGDTGLASLPVPAEIDDLPLVERIRALVTSLVDSDEQDFAGIARIARNLSAVVSLPRPMSDTEDLPLGGYSDIANRGTFDRLLVSELAQDPDILAVRVALNEALYLRRESPPRQPARRRAIFIDTGIRMWGLPRVFGHSLALAYAMQSERDAEVLIFTADGPASIDTTDGLTHLLGRLSPAPRPSSGFSQFLTEFAVPDTDCILITTPAVCADRDFQRRLAEKRDAEFFIATVDREGRYELNARNSAGERELQHANLDLDRLLSSEPDSPSTDQQLLRNRAGWLPRILRLESFPLRIAASLPVENTIYHPEVGLIGHSKDGMILHWDNTSRGAKLISDCFPKGLVSWMDIDADVQTAYFFIPRADGSALLIAADLANESVQQIQLTHGIERVFHVCRIGQVLVLLGHLQASGHHLQSGEQIFAHVTENFQRRTDRFVAVDGEWFAMTVGAQGLHLEKLPLPPGRSVSLVWEHPNWPAPLALLPELSVQCLTDPPQPVSESGPATFTRLERFSADRSRLLVLARPFGHNANQRYFIDFEQGKIADHNTSTFHRLEPEAMRMIERSPTVRNRYRTIAVSVSGNIYITSTRKRTVFVLVCETKGIPRLEWKPTPASVSEDAWQSFEEIESPAGAGFGLKQVKWADGSAAYLDFRGFLHLKSADDSIPEVTLTLKDGMVSGWASTGEWIGNPYFVGEQTTVAPSVVFGYVRQFAERTFAQPVPGHA